MIFSFSATHVGRSCYRLGGGRSIRLSYGGGSKWAEPIVPVFPPAVNGKGLPRRRQPSGIPVQRMTRTRITLSSAVTSSMTD